MINKLIVYHAFFIVIYNSFMQSNRERIKQLLNGDYTSNKVGYTPDLLNSNYKEGDIIKSENGDEWEIKNGVRVKKAKEATIIHREICKECGKDIRFSDMYRLDIQTWRPTGLCFDCFYKNETRLKEEGKWEEFNKRRNLEYEISYIKDCLSKFKEALDWCIEKKDKPIEFYNSDGSVEKWEGKEDVDALEKQIREDIKLHEDRLKQIQEELKKLNETKKE